MKKFDIVITSINNNSIFKNYYSNFKKYSSLDKARIIFVTDLKTPKDCYKEYLKYKSLGLDVIYLDINKQLSFLDKYKIKKDFFPYNSDNRRNIGYLYSYSLNDSEAMISIDDDNFAKKEYDFIGGHEVVFKSINSKTLTSSNNWFNNCQMLKFEDNLNYFPRGYPLEQRKENPIIKFTKRNNINIDVNAGMWLNAPDIDAITWLNSKPKAIKLKRNRLIMDKDTWCPINSQNTCLIKEAIPAYFFLKMNYRVNNQIIDRFGDIFSGYFLEKCTKHLGRYISFGTPLVDHNRNSHNFIKDAEREWNCLILCNKILKDLQFLKIEGSNYIDAYSSLTNILEERIEDNSYFDYEKKFIKSSLKDMRYWIRICKKIRG